MSPPPHSQSFVWLLAYIAAIMYVGYVVVCARKRMRKKTGFWAKQPAMHHQSWMYTYLHPRPTGVIQPTPPTANEVNAYLQLVPYISVVPLQDIIQSDQMKLYVQFIRLHYLHNRHTGNSFVPQLTTVVPFFENHAFPCYISTYHPPHSDVQGILTTRPLYVYLPNDDTRHVMQYYDYLCVDRNTRGKSVAAQIIQSHINHVRRMHPEIQSGIFKREDELTDIVPLVQYTTECFDIHAWCKCVVDSDATAGHVVEVVPHSLSLVWDFLYANRPPILVVPHITNAEQLVKTNNLWAYTSTSSTMDIRAVYFFRASNVSLAHGESVVHCIGSLCNHTMPPHEFVSAFNRAVGMLIKKVTMRYLAIENVADNHLLLSARCMSVLSSPTAYYLHNFSCTDAPYSPQSILVIS